jgi:transposase
MPTKSTRPRLIVTEEEREKLSRLARSRSAPHREVRRARILEMYLGGASFTDIAAAAGTTRRLVYQCVDRALGMGAEKALEDMPRPPRPARIQPEAKAWVVHLACCKPKDFGYAAEMWSLASLARHAREHCGEEGHPSLRRAAKATVQRILKEQELRPHKVRYYLERRDPEFAPRMREVLLVYREVATAPLEGQKAETGEPVYTVSVDEKPGVQALAVTAPDLPPVPGRHKAHGRDHEYRRLGTASILAALDLQDGHITARVEERHRSREFVMLLQDLDAHYPKDGVIRVVLDHHSVHTSKETRAYLATRPNRFRYVHTPKHGSWLNLVETLFSKMERTFLRGIRVGSWGELKERIEKGIAEINADPVVHKWKNFDALSEPEAI